MPPNWQHVRQSRFYDAPTACSTGFDARLVGAWRIFRNCSLAIFGAMLESSAGDLSQKGV